MTVRPQREIAPADRARALDAYDDLVAHAEERIAEGFHHSEHHELVVVHAKQCDLVLWPTLVKRIIADARWSTPSPVWGG